MWRFDFGWRLRVRRELECCAKKVVDVLVVPPSSGNGSKYVYAAVDEFEAFSKAKSPLNISLKCSLGVFCGIQGLGSLNHAGSICGQGFILTKGDGFEVNTFFRAWRW